MKAQSSSQISTRIGGSALKAVLAVACAALWANAPANAEEVRLKLHTYVPLTVPPMQHVFRPWAQELEKGSGGTLKVDIFPLMQLGGRPPQLVEQVKDNVVEMVWTILGATPGRFPRTEVFELPFVHQSTLASNLALREMMSKELAKDFADVHPLILHVHAGNAIHMRSESISSLDGFRLKKIRSPGQTSTEFLSAIGASPIATSLTEISSMMSRGVLDGAMLPFDVLPAIKLHSMVRHHVLMEGDRRPTTAVFLLAMSKKSYQSLSPEHRALIGRTTGMEMSRKSAEVMERFDNLGMELARKGGAQIVELSGQETAKVIAAAKPVIDDWSKRIKDLGEDPERLLAKSRELGQKYREAAPARK